MQKLERATVQCILLLLICSNFIACNLKDKFAKNTNTGTSVSSPTPSVSPSPSPSPSVAPIPVVTPTPSESPTDQYLKFDESKIRTIPINSGSGRFTYDITKDLGEAILSSDESIQISGFETDLFTSSCEKLIDENNRLFAVTCSYEKGGEVGHVYKVHSTVENAAGLRVDAYAYLQVSSNFLELKKEIVDTIMTEGKYELSPKTLIDNGTIAASSENVFILKYDFYWSENTEIAQDEKGNITQLTIYSPKADVGKTLEGVVVFGLESSAEIVLEAKVVLNVVSNSELKFDESKVPTLLVSQKTGVIEFNPSDLIDSGALISAEPVFYYDGFETNFPVGSCNKSLDITEKFIKKIRCKFNKNDVKVDQTYKYVMKITNKSEADPITVYSYLTVVK